MTFFLLLISAYQKKKVLNSHIRHFLVSGLMLQLMIFWTQKLIIVYIQKLSITYYVCKNQLKTSNLVNFALVSSKHRISSRADAGLILIRGRFGDCATCLYKHKELCLHACIVVLCMKKKVMLLVFV